MLLKRYKFEFVLLTLLILFIFAKAKTLGLHLFWDETLYLVPRFLRNGFSELLPGNYHPHPWFGHPPLFQVLHYLVNAFTETIRYSAHLTALLSYLFFSISIYIYLSKMIGKLEAISTLVFLTMIPPYFAQTTMFLPNFLAIGLGLLSHYFFIQRKIFLYILFVSLAFLTRESTLAFMVGASLIGIFWVKEKKISLKEWGLSLGPYILPILYFALIKSKTGSLVGHPYFSFEPEKEATVFSLLKNKAMFIDAIKISTFLYWHGILLIALACLFIFKLWKVKTKLLLQIKQQITSDYFTLLSVTAGFYLAFFALYVHTIPRDIILVSLLFQLGIVILISHSFFINHKFKKAPLIVLVFFQVFYLYPYQKMDLGRDQSERSQEINIKTMKEITLFLESTYNDKTKVFAHWPGGELLRNPEFEYTQNLFNASDQNLDEAEVFIKAKIFSKYLENLNNEYQDGDWKLIKSFKDEHRGVHKSPQGKMSFQIYERQK